MRVPFSQAAPEQSCGSGIAGTAPQPQCKKLSVSVNQQIVEGNIDNASGQIIDHRQLFDPHAPESDENQVVVEGGLLGILTMLK